MKSQKHVEKMQMLTCGNGQLILATCRNVSTEIYKIVNGIAHLHLINIISKIFKNSWQKKETLLIMVSKHLHTGRLFFGQTYHQNINLQVH